MMRRRCHRNNNRSTLLLPVFVVGRIVLRCVLLSAPVGASKHPLRYPLSSSRWNVITPGTRSSDQARKRQPRKCLLTLRGGASAATDILSSSEDASSYYIQQQLSLQSRSLQLRQALVARGLVELSHSAASSASQSKKSADWECALSTPQHPKSCLYSLDAEYGQKVIVPLPIIDASSSSAATPAWITLTALNRLFRTDPTKVDALWYHQYDIVSTWFRARHPFSLYAHYRSPRAALITAALNLQPPWLLGALSLTAIVTLLTFLCFPLLEYLLTKALVSPVLWRAWPTWGRLVHAALPLQLLLGQMALGAVGQLVQDH